MPLLLSCHGRLWGLQLPLLTQMHSTEMEKHMDLVLYIHLFKVNELKIENGIEVCFINQFVRHSDDHN